MENNAAFFRFGVGVVNELNFAFRHPGGNQFLANIIVDIEVAIIFRCREVAEQMLCQLLLFAFFPNLQHVPNTGVQLAVGVVRQNRVHQTDIQTDLSAIVGDAEHIILRRIHRAGMDFRGALAQPPAPFLSESRTVSPPRFQTLHPAQADEADRWF